MNKGQKKRVDLFIKLRSNLKARWVQGEWVGGWMSTGVEEGWCSISKETAAARWTAGWATQGVGRGESGFVLNGLKRVFIEITTKS